MAIPYHNMDPDELMELIKKGEVVAMDARFFETLVATLDSIIAQIADPPQLPYLEPHPQLKAGYNLAREDLDKILPLYAYFHKLAKIDENIH
jgi:hypothetical protein